MINNNNKRLNENHDDLVKPANTNENDDLNSKKPLSQLQKKIINKMSGSNETVLSRF
jgi:hypothetical protein